MKQIFKDTSIYFATDILVKGLVFFSWFYIARIVSVADIGQYTLAYFVVELASTYILFGMGSSLLIQYMEYKERSLVFAIHVMTFLFISLVLAWIGMSSFVASWLVRFSLQNYLFIAQDAFFILTWTYVFSMCKLLGQYFVADRNVRAFSRVQTGQSILYLVFIFVLQHWTRDYHLLVFARLGSLMVITIWLLVQLGLFNELWISIKRDRIYFASTFKLGFPFFVQNLVGIVGFYFSRLIIERSMSLDAVGVYSFYFMLFTNINMILAAFDNAFMPRMVAWISQGIRENINLINHAMKAHTVLFLVGLSMLIFLIDRTSLFQILLTDQYRPYLPLFVVLVSQMYFGGVIVLLRPFYYYNKRVSLMTIFSFILIAANFAINFLFIRWWGLGGAALGTVVLVMFQMVLYLLFERDYLRYARAQAYEIAWMSCFVCVLMCLATWGTIQKSLFLWVFVGLLVYTWTNRSVLKIFLRPDTLDVLRQPFDGKSV
jgi:O-antigen/teichoic acid export membrane protein